jgi:hypothetical protein
MRIGAPIDVVYLLVSFRKVDLGLFGLFLLISPFSHLEYFICETLESVAVPSLVLSLGVEDANAIQEAFKFTRPGPVLLVASWPFHYIMEQSSFLFLLWPLDELGWSTWLESFSFFCSLVSRVASSARAYLLAMVNIASDILGYFLVSLRIRAGSLSPFLKNKTMDLSSTSGMIFLLLQNCWMNSQRDTPFFWMTLARS